MADCYAPEADDLHRRWLPREIFADIGIADPAPAAAADAAPPASATVEELAAQLAGILGGGGKGKAAPLGPPPPPPGAIANNPCHPAQVCGMEGALSVYVAYGGPNGFGPVGGAWPVMPYSPVQWQAASAFVNIGGVLDYPMLPPAPPCRVPPPPLPAPAPASTKLRCGTGVFLPRAEVYRPAAPPPAKEVKAPSTKTWIGKPQQQQLLQHQRIGKTQQWQKGMQPRQQSQQKATAAAVHARAEAALPQD